MAGSATEDTPIGYWLKSGTWWPCLTGTFRYVNTYADTIALVASGHIDLKAIITGHYTLAEAEQALQATKSDPANIKSVVVPK